MSREAFVVEYSTADGRKRVRFHPKAKDCEMWIRTEQEWTGCTWRTIGREPVTDFVAVDTAEVLE